MSTPVPHYTVHYDSALQAELDTDELNKWAAEEQAKTAKQPPAAAALALPAGWQAMVRRCSAE